MSAERVPTGAGSDARLSPAVRNVLANWAGYVLGLVINFLLSPLVVNHLGPSAYGVWTLLAAITAYLGLLDLGVRSAVTRFVARSRDRGERGTAVVVATALAFFAVMSAVAVVVSAALGVAAPRWFHIPPEYTAATPIVTVLAGATIGAALLGGTLGGVLAGLERFDLLSLVDVGTALVRAALILGVIATNGGLIDLAIAQFAAALTATVATAWLSARIYPAIPLRLAWSRTSASLLLSYSGYAFVAQLAGSIIERAGVIVVGAFLPMMAVAAFGIAGGLMEYARALAGGIRTTLAPRASALEGRGQHDALRQLTLNGARYCTLLVLPIAVTLGLRGESFIGLWMGSEYAEPSGAVLAVLAVRLVFLGATGAAANVMLGANRERVVAGVFVGEAVVSVTMMAVLVRPFGIAGVAWGMAVPTVASALLVWPYLLNRRLGVDIRSYVRAGWLVPLSALMPFLVATWLVERWWPASSLLLFASQVVLLLPIGLAGLWAVGLPAAEREALGRLVRPLTARGAAASRR